jgi:hypothetical protein
MLLAGATFGALAQYKIVSPDGKVTYTDKPPTAGDVRMGGNGAAAPDANGGMPYETRQAVSRYPVTLYAAKSCAPCDSVRQWLRQHAIPFNEYAIDSPADRLALQQRFSDASLPVTTIGSTTLKGFAAADLQSYIDAAGYPSQGRLIGYSLQLAAGQAPGAARSRAGPRGRGHRPARRGLGADARPAATEQERHPVLTRGWPAARPRPLDRGPAKYPCGHGDPLAARRFPPAAHLQGNG